MVLIGLLVVAVVALILGWVTSSDWLFVVSLVASVLAALVLVRFVIKQRAEVAAPGEAEAAKEPRKSRRSKSEPASEPAASAAVGDTAVLPAAVTGVPVADVVVVDGRPDYHLSSCDTLAGADAEPVPLSQALEDGFTPCDICSPPTSVGADQPHPVDVPVTVHEEPAAADVAPVAEVPPVTEVWVVDGSPEFHVAGCDELTGRPGESIPLAQALEDGFQPCAVCKPGAPAAEVVDAVEDEPDTSLLAASMAAPVSSPDRSVWVADGYPEYHLGGCAELSGLSSESVPYEQAVEDGFQPCVVCNPDAVLGVADPDGDEPEDSGTVESESDTDDESNTVPEEAVVAGSQVDDDVWVVDGFPDYHRAGCRLLAGQDAVAVPRSQAVEDGFAECEVCTPEAAEAPDSAFVPPSADSPDVWVVDGSPDYHRPECSVILGQDSEPIPHEQAVEDGFTACSVCAPDAAEAPAQPEPVVPPAEATAPEDAVPETPAPVEEVPVGADVWVVDGFPDYHRPDCPTLVGLDSEPVPHDQAVEDGFGECAVCRPEAARAPEYPDTPAPAAAQASADTDVWVVDGFPDYHRADCSAIAGQNSEPIPHDQAVEDGFSECTVCTPDAAEAPAAPVVEPEPVAAEPEPLPEPEPTPEPEPVLETPEAAPVAAAPVVEPEAAAVAEAEPAAAATATVTATREVWVIDGRPRYHTHDCLIIKGQKSTGMPVDEAVADGFKPCSLCRA